LTKKNISKIKKKDPPSNAALIQSGLQDFVFPCFILDFHFVGLIFFFWAGPLVFWFQWL
jgi:hypothetical protein